jgi:hypothetical protein
MMTPENMNAASRMMQGGGMGGMGTMGGTNMPMPGGGSNTANTAQAAQPNANPYAAMMGGMGGG